MALINCYECKAEISDKSSSCIRCGAPILDASMATEETTIPTDLSEKIVIVWQIAHDGSSREIQLMDRNGDIHLLGATSRLSDGEIELSAQDVEKGDLLHIGSNYTAGGHIASVVKKDIDAASRYEIRQQFPKKPSGVIHRAKPIIEYAPVTLTKRQSEEMNRKESRGSLTWQPKWIIQGAAALFLLWLFFSDEGSKFVGDILKGINTSTNISEYDCEKLADLVTGESLQNMFGARFEIIRVTEMTQISKSDQSLVCRGNVFLSNNSSRNMELSIQRQGSSIAWSVSPL